MLLVALNVLSLVYSAVALSPRTRVSYLHGEWCSLEALIDGLLMCVCVNALQLRSLQMRPLARMARHG